MTVEANFSKTSGSVALARRFTEEVLGGISGAVAAEIVLMVSELATNAVLHAATSFRLRLERTNDFVRVEIADGGSGDVHRRSLSEWDLHGRGLQIVAKLSDQWGMTEPRDGEKAVWFVRNLRPLAFSGFCAEASPSNTERSRPRKATPAVPGD